MQTKIIKIQEVKKQQADFAAAGEIIKQGGLVAFPTETVNGLMQKLVPASMPRRDGLRITR